MPTRQFSVFSSALLAAALVSFAWLAPGRAAAQHFEPGQSDCSTPRRALLTWLGNLQAGAERPDVATRCFDWGATRVESSVERQARARELKQVLDARGLYVPMDEIPDETDPEDTLRVTPFPNNLEVFYLVKKGERWVISAETIRAIDDLHAETFAFNVQDAVAGFPPWLRTPYFGVAAWQLGLGLLALLLGLLIRLAIRRSIETWGIKVATRFATKVDPEPIKKAAAPVGTFVMMLLLFYLAPVMSLSVRFNRLLLFGLRVGATVAAVLVVYRLADVISGVFTARAAKTESKFDDQLVPMVRKSFKAIVVVVGILFVLESMEIEVDSLIAGVSLGGLAFSLAARDTVANLFGSFSIFVDQPFQVGDWIKVDDIEGVVEEVGMRSSRVRTFYRALVTVPNSTIAAAAVINYGARDLRRCFTTLGLTYSTTPEQMEAFCDGVRAILANNAKVKKDSYEVHFSGFGASSLEVMLYFFFECGTWSEELRNRHLIFLEILRLAQELNVEFAFPTQTLHVESVAEPQARGEGRAPSVEELGAAVLAFGPKGEKARPLGPKISAGFYAGAAARGDSGS